MKVRARLIFFSHIQAKAQDWCLNYSPDASPSERELHAGTMSPLDYLQTQAAPGVSAADFATLLCRFAYAACHPRAGREPSRAVLAGLKELLASGLSQSNCIDALHALPHSVIWTLDQSKERFERVLDFLDRAYQLLPQDGRRLDGLNSLKQCKSLEQLRNLPHPSPSSASVGDTKASAYTDFSVEMALYGDMSAAVQLASQLDRPQAVYEAVARMEDVTLAYGECVKPIDVLHRLCRIVQPQTVGSKHFWFENHRPFLSAIGRLVSVDCVAAHACAVSIARIPKSDAWIQVGPTSILMNRLKVLMAVAYAKLGEKNDASFPSDMAKTWNTELIGHNGNVPRLL